MRRWLVWCCCGWLIWLTGCQAVTDENAAPVTTGFSCEAAIRYKDMDITGLLTRSGAGTLSLEFLSPDTLKGIVATWDGEKVTASLYGMSIDLPPDTLPASALGSALTEALDAAFLAPEQGQLTEEGFRWEGVGPNGTMVLLTDPEDGSLRSLSLPQIPLTVSFSRFKLSS